MLRTLSQDIRVSEVQVIFIVLSVRDMIELSVKAPSSIVLSALESVTEVRDEPVKALTKWLQSHYVSCKTRLSSQVDKQQDSSCLL